MAKKRGKNRLNVENIISINNKPAYIISGSCVKMGGDKHEGELYLPWSLHVTVFSRQ